MNELYSIMRDFLEVSYHQESLLCLLKAAETAYSDEGQTKAKLTAGSTTFYQEALQEELQTAINRMDTYIAANAKRR